MKPLVIFLFCLFFIASNSVAQSYLLEKDKYVVDTGICKINTPVKFSIYLIISGGYAGLRYKTTLDFGDNSTFEKADTLKQFGVYSNFTTTHTYLSGGNKTIKLYLLDSINNRVDSIVRIYNVGGCEIATGRAYSDGKPDCTFEPAENVFANGLISFNKNGTLISYKVDSSGYFNIPVFPGDTLNNWNSNQWGNCQQVSITKGATNINWPMKYDGAWGYVANITAPDYVCAGLPGNYFHHSNITIPGSPWSNSSADKYHLNFDLGDGTTSGGYYKVNATSMNDNFMYTIPGYYKARAGLYYNYKLIYFKEFWIHVDSCRNVKLKLYADIDKDCNYDTTELGLAKVGINTTPKWMPKNYYQTDTNGLITMLVYPGDTVMLDSVCTFKPVWYNMWDPHHKISISKPCQPGYVTASDTFLNIAFIPMTVKGKIFVDANGNCKRDPAEKGMSAQMVSATYKSSKTTVLSDTSGNYELSLTPNRPYIIEVNHQASGLTVCSAGRDSFLIVKDTAGLDFGYFCKSQKDASLDFYHNVFAPGSMDTLFVGILNDSCDTTSATVFVELDTNVNYIQASQIPKQITGNKLEFGIDNMSLYYQKPIKITIGIPLSVQSGDTLCHSAHIVPTFTDVNPGNNLKKLCAVTICNSQQDASLNLYHTAFEAGNTDTLYVNILNDSCDTASATVLVNLDTSINYIHASLAPTQVTGNQLEFSIGNMSLYYQKPIEILVSIPSNMVTGDTLCYNASIVPSFTDVNPSNNHRVLCDTVKSTLGLISFQGTDMRSFAVYPNPVNAILFVDIKSKSGFFRILAMDSRKLAVGELVSGKNKVNISPIPSGIYLFQIQVDGNTYYERLIIE